MQQLQRSLEHWIGLVLLVRGRVRARLLALRGATIKPKARMGARCRVERPWCIRAGRGFHAEDDVYLKIVSDDAQLEFGDAVFVGRGTEFDVAESVTVGAHTIIAPGCFVTDHNHGISPQLRIDQQGCISRRVEIGRDVWLGANVVVVAGVTIGDGAVVGAGSIVTRDVPSMAIVAGVPARILRSRDSELRDAIKADQFADRIRVSH
jgi:acetyltransferase-like isoleucine patch superfamily enzyme